MKQSYKLEDIRVLTYRLLKNLIALVLAAGYFAAAYTGERLKLGIPAHATVGPLGAHNKPLISLPQLGLFDGYMTREKRRKSADITSFDLTPSNRSSLRVILKLT